MAAAGHTMAALIKCYVLSTQCMHSFLSEEIEILTGGTVLIGFTDRLQCALQQRLV